MLRGWSCYSSSSPTMAPLNKIHFQTTDRSLQLKIGLAFSSTMWTLIACVIKASQVVLQISFPPHLRVSSMQQPQRMYHQFLTSSTMIASVSEVQAPQHPPPHLPHPLLPPPNLIFSTATAFAKEVPALHILQARVISLLQYQVGALLFTSQAQSAAAARVKAQPLAARRE